MRICHCDPQGLPEYVVLHHLVDHPSAPWHSAAREVLEHGELHEFIEDAYAICAKSRGKLIDQLGLEERLWPVLEDPGRDQKAEASSKHELTDEFDS
jgi:hypothetical protein